MKKIEDKTITGIFKNIIKAIIIILYFLIISILYLKVENNILQNYIKVLAIALLGIAIYTFEKSYKKDNEFIFLEAVEYILILLHTLTITYITNKYKVDFRKYVIASSYIFASYFVLKAIIIYTKSERDYAKSLSDIPEIVKKEEPQVKEATKKKKEEPQVKETNTKTTPATKSETKTTKPRSTTKSTTKTTKQRSTTKSTTKTTKPKNTTKSESTTTKAKNTTKSESTTTKARNTEKTKTKKDDKKEVKEND